MYVVLASAKVGTMIPVYIGVKVRHGTYIYYVILLVRCIHDIVGFD